MTKKSNDKEKNLKSSVENEVIQEIERVCNCDKLPRESKMIIFDEPSLLDPIEENINFVNDECNLDVEIEYQKLIKILDLSEIATFLSKIETYFPRSLKYGVRSGVVHMSMHKYSPLTRGLQVKSVIDLINIRYHLFLIF